MSCFLSQLINLGSLSSVGCPLWSLVHFSLPFSLLACFSHFLLISLTIILFTSLFCLQYVWKYLYFYRSSLSYRIGVRYPAFKKFWTLGIQMSKIVFQETTRLASHPQYWTRVTITNNFSNKMNVVGQLMNVNLVIRHITRTVWVSVWGFRTRPTP